MGALSTPGAKVVMAGNPTRTSGFFYDTHHSLRDRWHTMHVNCLDVPRAQGHIDDKRWGRVASDRCTKSVGHADERSDWPGSV
jgi:hypothetical protein